MSETQNWLQKSIEEGHIQFITYDNFSNVKAIARGAFGEVSKAFWNSAEKFVALKTLYADPGSTSKDSFEDLINEVSKGTRERFISGTPIDYKTLYERAWNGDPSLRPDIEEMRDKLDKIRLEPKWYETFIQQPPTQQPPTQQPPTQQPPTQQIQQKQPIQQIQPIQPHVNQYPSNPNVIGPNGGNIVTNQTPYGPGNAPIQNVNYRPNQGIIQGGGYQVPNQSSGYPAYNQGGGYPYRNPVNPPVQGPGGFSAQNVGGRPIQNPSGYQNYNQGSGYPNLNQGGGYSNPGQGGYPNPNPNPGSGHPNQSAVYPNYPIQNRPIQNQSGSYSTQNPPMSYPHTRPYQSPNYPSNQQQSIPMPTPPQMNSMQQNLPYMSYTPPRP
ncbi:2295_t:CDS:2, partial [Racocetra persica]